MELACGMSALALGTMDEKLQVCFDLFDSEGRRALTLKDLNDLCTTLFKVALSHGSVNRKASTDEVMAMQSGALSQRSSETDLPFPMTPPMRPSSVIVVGREKVRASAPAEITKSITMDDQELPSRSMLLRLLAAAKVHTPGGQRLVAYEVGSAEDIPEDGTNARVYQILKEKNYPVLMVDAAAGKSFGKLTVTDSKFSSYEELRVAHENGLDILPLRVCDDPWPPEPPCGPENKYDEMGEGKDENYIAKKIAETLLPGGRERICSSRLFLTLLVPMKRRQGSPGMGGQEWCDLGSRGGGKRNGQRYSKQDCYVKALELDENYARAWSNLGLEGGGSVKGQAYDEKGCYVKALEADENFAKAWNSLGVEGGGTVKGQAYGEKGCYVKALELDENDALAWRNLGLEGGGSVKGQAYDEKGCCVKALELDENDAGAWFNLGCVGGSTVKGQDYDAKGCYIKALELDENDAFAWNNLGNRGGGTVKGQDYDAKACHVKSLELNEKNAATWYNLGLKGGSTVKGQAYDKKDCFVRALELNENDARFWRQLGKAGGGTVRGTHYVPDECKAKAAGK
ncbi:ogt-1 [Symbiodinium necroappetens]|uniref:Ogt-1 protein n=1 Tax=Symbiodinium necroappetens TaxID=1628268 RepID=A0A812V4H6_9DINO|nr:ogt-1 [Symbiodinium necroappetens]